MKISRKLIIASFGSLILWSLSLLTFSCTKNQPTAPDDNTSLVQPVERGRGGRGGHDMEISNVQYVGDKQSKDFYSKADYMSIKVMDGFYSYFSVPANALNKKTTVSVQVIQGTNSQNERLSQYDFGPDGTNFKNSAALVHYTGALDGSIAELWWFNPSTGVWEFVAASTIANKKVSFKIDHFSSYTVWEASPTGSGQ